MTEARDPDFGLVGYGSSTYGESFADVYDQWYADLPDTDFVDFICAHLGAEPARVLELGVGTGRLASLLIAKRAPIVDTIVGIDSSTAMLDRARGNLHDRVELVEGDFSLLLPEGPFDVVFVGYNTFFNLADTEAMSRCLGLVASRLAPGGRFVIDVVTPPRDGGSDHVGLRSMSATDVVLSVSRHDPADQRLVGHFIQFTDGGPVRVRPWAVRYLSPGQLDALAQENALVLETRSANGNGLAFDTDSERHISSYRRG